MWIVLKILPNSNDFKTLKDHDLGAVKKILTYVISWNPDIHLIFLLPKIWLIGVYLQYKTSIDKYVPHGMNVILWTWSTEFLITYQLVWNGLRGKQRKAVKKWLVHGNVASLGESVKVG